MSLTGKPSLTTAAAFTNDGFWPDLSVGEFMSKYRIQTEYADETINWGLTLAVVNVNIDLEPCKAAAVLLGHASLVDYTTAFPEPINAMQVLVIHYLNAVYCMAKAQLLPQFNTMNRRAIAEAAGKESAETEQFWLDQSTKSVQLLFAHFLPLESHTANFGVRATLL